MRTTTEIKELALKIKKSLLDLYGTGIRQVILYGSYARRDADEDSDIDLLVVVGEEISPSEVEESLDDLLFEVLIEKGELVSVMAIPEGIFRSYNSPLFLNVRRGGYRYERDRRSDKESTEVFENC